jgi:NNP family nitrate/nitrite transporter-like MFS transporter
LISICLFAATFALQAITADMPVFAGAMGHGPLATAKLSAWVTVAMIAGCVVAGRVSDLSARRAKHAGIARLWSMLPAYLIIIAIIPIFAFGDMERLPLLCAAGAVLTLGAAWGLGAFYSIIPELFPADKVPTATGIVGGVGDIGMPVAPMVVGVLFGIQGRWDLGWGACAVFSVISAAVLFVLIGYVRRENRSVARHPRYRSSDSLFSPDMP